MKRIRTWGGLVLFALAVGAVLFVPAAWVSSPKSDAGNIRITIPSNANGQSVAAILKEKGILTSTVGYRLYAFFDSSATHPKAGDYTVQPGMSYRTLARQFFFGPEREEIEVKIIEGWSLDDEASLVTGLDAAWETPLVSEWVADYPFLSSLSRKATLEGFLFPDTYRVWKDQLPQGLIKKQLDAFATRAFRLIEGAEKQGRTLNEVVTLASIVEKEVANPEDRKIVAGIFWNRLQSGMPLQSDATVNYVTHAGRTRPTIIDLAVESAYNTYAHRGLPPGPICNPGADALEAALNPAKTPYRYFLTDANGKTYFARTLEEHILNRKKAFGP